MYKYKEINEEIKQLGKELELDETLRTVCLFCGGGSEKERSFAITRKESLLLYYCHRSSCGKRGVVGGTCIYREKSTQDNFKDKQYKFREYKGELSEVADSAYKDYLGKYGITKQECVEQGIRFAKDISRIYFPIYDYRGFQYGENLKAISTEQKPKTLINRWTDGPLIHWPLGQKMEEVLVLVEDQISAIKTSKIVLSASLLGTNLKEEGLSLFRKIGITKIILMMDGDEAGYKATSKLNNMLSSFFKVYTSYLPLGKDPKDLSLEDLRRLCGISRKD